MDDDAEAALRRVILSRTARISKPTVVTLSKLPADTARRLLPGTIVFFAAPSWSRTFEQLCEAARAVDCEMLDLLADRIGSDLVRVFVSAERQPDARTPHLDDVPSLGEFRYKHKQLVRGMFPVGTWDVAAASIIWTGGPLADDEFSFVEYVASSGAPVLQTLIVKIPPRLSDVERAVIAQVPERLSELHVRGSDVAVTDALMRVVGQAVRAAGDALLHFVFAPRRMTLRRGGPGTLFEVDAVGICGPLPYTLIGGTMPSSVRARLESHVKNAAVDPARLGACVDVLLDLRQELLTGRIPEELG